MWGSKKPERPQAASPEPKDLQTNQPLTPVPALRERTTELNKDASRPIGEPGDRATSRLGSSVHLKGDISGNEDLHIDGTVEGLVQLDERKLTIGTTANVTAEIFAGEVVVYGKLKGNVRARGRIEVKKDGSVDGDLTTAQILIEDGAYFKGSLEIERSTEEEGDKKVFPPAA